MAAWCMAAHSDHPIKCPPRGPESSKEYCNFKNFYSFVLMAFVDASFIGLVVVSLQTPMTLIYYHAPSFQKLPRRLISDKYLPFSWETQHFHYKPGL
jgi:hypothetical protein